MLLKKVKTRDYAEDKETDGSLRQPAVTGKDSHKGSLANDQRASSTFRLTLLLPRSVIASLMADECNSS